MSTPEKVKLVLNVGDLVVEFCHEQGESTIDISLEGLYAAEFIELPDDIVELVDGNIEVFNKLCSDWLEEYPPCKLIHESLTWWYSQKELKEQYGYPAYGPELDIDIDDVVEFERLDELEN